MKTIWLLLPVWALSASGLPASALTKCTVGQQVLDPLGKTGVIDWSGGDFCRVKYEGGVMHGWTAASLKAEEKPAKPDAGISSSATVATGKSAGETRNAALDDMVLRPAARSLVYHADRLGHFELTATINGRPIRVVVDTGATVVSLSLADAAAVGIDTGSLAFTVKTNTANGQSRVAPVILRNVSIGSISVDAVHAVVNKNLNQSLLGMSFLSRLRGFEIREGSLTISR
jgi:aspartyl protease family protein